MPTTGGVQLKKRGLSSSPATSSSRRRRIKLKKPLLIHRRGGTSTPAPMWKTNVGSRSPCSDAPGITQNFWSPEVLEGAEGVVSARKLVSVLWQLSNDNNKDRELSEISHDRVSDISSYYRTKRHRRKTLEEDDQRQIDCPWYKEERSRSSHSNCNNAMLVKSCNQQSPGNSVRDSTNHGLKHLTSSITASREILKALIHLLVPEKMQSSSLSLFSALHSELNRARVHLNRLEEKETLRKREKEKIILGFEMVIEELEAEKKARRKVEKLNKRLEITLIQLEKSILEATEELDRERRSRERVERVCKELVRGIGEDRAKVEELKRQAVNMQEELERERELLQVEIEKEKEMLQIADEWREERVQMKLSEARCQFEEKNSAIDELRNELEAYLVSKKQQESEILFHGESDQVTFQEKEMNESVNIECSRQEHDGEIDIQENAEDDDDDDDENMCSESNGLEFEEKNKAIDQLRIELETYISSKIQEGELCAEVEYERENSNSHDAESDSGDDSDLQSIELDMENGMKWDFKKMRAGGTSLFDKDRERMYQTDVERYNLVKGLRDNMLAGSGIVVEKNKSYSDSNNRI